MIIKKYTLFMLCVSFLGCASNKATHSTQESASREELISSLTSDGTVDAHTCKRVASFGKGKISPEECKAKFPEANKHCLEVTRKNVPENITNEADGRLIAQILMSCPMAKILNYPYSIIDGKPKIEFPENI
jgi:hypothetical protein